MNIDEMSDQEKSVLLAKCMGWEFSRHDCGEARWSWVDNDGQQISGSLHDATVKAAKDDPALYVAPMLYEPARMALAWQVHLWACNNRFGSNTWEYLRWFEASKIFEYEDAQRRWLDKAAKLAIEAGLVETPAQANEVDPGATNDR